jgi:hypothetical protein
MTVTYNPEIHLESATRSLKDYAERGFDVAVQDINSNDSGLEVYEVMMEFPSDEKIREMIPFKKSVIHFELDDIQDYLLSFGMNTAKLVFDDVLKETHEQEGRRHILNFDVGIWTWDKSGGTTARLRARQTLTNLFSGAQAITNLREASDGGDGQLEIISYTNGHFMTEFINDIRVFRMINSTLSLRVFSRTPNPIITPSIEDIQQDWELVLDDELQL